MSWLVVILVFLLASIKTTKGSDKSVSIVIPAFNEEATVAKVVSVARKLSYVDEVIVYESVETILPKVDFDVFAIGEDQVHEGFRTAVKWCEDNGKEVVRLKRTPGISSSDIKDEARAML